MMLNYIKTLVTDIAKISVADFTSRVMQKKLECF